MANGRNSSERPTFSQNKDALVVSIWVMRSGWIILHVSLIFNVIAIGTPYWIVSTTDDYHDGIWPSVDDPVCTHVLHRHHLTDETWHLNKSTVIADFDSDCGSLRGSYYVRNAMDDWIKGVQAPMALGVIFLLLASVAINCGVFAADWNIRIALIFITICSAFTSGSFTFITICVFGLRYHSLLRPQNYNLSWSYGLAVVSCVIAYCASLLLVAEMHIRAVVIPLNKKKDQHVTHQSVPRRDQSQQRTETLPMETVESATNDGCRTPSTSVQSPRPNHAMVSETDRRALKFSFSPVLATKADMIFSQREKARSKSGIVRQFLPSSQVERSENGYFDMFEVSPTISSGTLAATANRELTSLGKTKQTSYPNRQAKCLESDLTRSPCSQDDSTVTKQDQELACTSSRGAQTYRSQPMDILSRDTTKDPLCIEVEPKAQDSKPLQGSFSATEEHTVESTTEHHLNTSSCTNPNEARLGLH